MAPDQREQLPDGYLYIGDLSGDAQEVIARGVAKFREGGMEHGPLDLSSLHAVLPREFANEMRDGYWYLIMIEVTLERLFQLLGLLGLRLPNQTVQ
jgi:hypothetical protein